MDLFFLDIEYFWNIICTNYRIIDDLGSTYYSIFAQIVQYIPMPTLYDICDVFKGSILGLEPQMHNDT